MPTALRRVLPSAKFATTSFVVYLFSLIAAFSWNTAVQNYITEHEKFRWWARWAWAAGITVIALTVITLILVFDTNEPTVGRMPQMVQRSGQ